MRGKPDSTNLVTSGAGITPADAGKTPSIRHPAGGGRDHPRGCGENCLVSCLTLPPLGSPPRMRGKRHDYAEARYWRRDHPRGCGENEDPSRVLQTSSGSPPRMRGKPMLSKQDLDAARITPADAGKTDGNRL